MDCVGASVVAIAYELFNRFLRALVEALREEADDLVADMDRDRLIRRLSLLHDLRHLQCGAHPAAMLLAASGRTGGRATSPRSGVACTDVGVTWRAESARADDDRTAPPRSARLRIPATTRMDDDGSAVADRVVDERRAVQAA